MTKTEIISEMGRLWEEIWGHWGERKLRTKVRVGRDGVWK